jgi:hypothetical protein
MITLQAEQRTASPAPVEDARAGHSSKVSHLKTLTDCLEFQVGLKKNLEHMADLKKTMVC